MEFLQNGQIEPNIIGKEYFIFFIHFQWSSGDISIGLVARSIDGTRSNGKWIKYTEHHKRKTEANTKDKPNSKDENEKIAQGKTEITETVTDTSGKDLEVMKKKPEREFEEPKDETAKDEAA